MTQTRKTSIWRVPIGEPILWLLPAVFAFLGHLLASGKAQWPAWCFLVFDDKTAASQALWRMVHDHLWVFLVYAVLLQGLCWWMKLRGARWWLRAAALPLFALPGVLYWLVCNHLLGKLIRFG